jgi:HlyD family secretion protein
MDDRTQNSPQDIAARLGLGKARAPRGRRTRQLLYGALALGLLLAAGFFFFRPRAPHYVTGTVTQGTLTVLVSATGTLKPLNQVDVGAEISGRIVALHADFNDQVAKGQVLAELDTAELKARSLQSQAALANAQATLVETRAKRDRVAALRKSGTSSKEDLDIAQAAFDRAQAAIAQASAQHDADETTLGRAQIRAPIDGIVLDRKVEVGQTVAAAFQTPILFTLAEDLRRMRLHADIDEADVGRVHEGAQARFTVDAYPGRNFAAVVHEFRNAPHTSEGVVTYEAVLDVENPDLALRPGMTANADIIASTLGNARLVPNGALRFTPPGYRAQVNGTAEGLPRLSAVRLDKDAPAPPVLLLGDDIGVVWTGEHGTPQPHALKLGLSDGLHTAVLGGELAPGTALLIDVERKAATGS